MPYVILHENELIDRTPWPNRDRLWLKPPITSNLLRNGFLFN